MTVDPLAAAVVSAATWIILVVAGHFALFHLVPVERRARALVSLFALGLAGHGPTALSLGADGWRAALGALLIGCAVIVYMPFYYTIAASLSVGMLLDIQRTPGGLSPEELHRRYPLDTLLAGRLRTLVASGYLRPVGDRFAITPRGRAIAVPFRAIKALWRLGPGG